MPSMSAARRARADRLHDPAEPDQPPRGKGKGSIPVATIVTQVVVEKADPAFANPTKPVGPFYSADEAARLKKEKGYDVKEDAGRGWRRVVASPDPVEIFEKEAIRQLVDARTIVIASGGAGSPSYARTEG